MAKQQKIGRSVLESPLTKFPCIHRYSHALTRLVAIKEVCIFNHTQITGNWTLNISLNLRILEFENGNKYLTRK